MMWSLVWWPHAMANGINPLLTTAIWAPSGFNLAWGTCIPLASILASPLTLTLDPSRPTTSSVSKPPDYCPLRILAVPLYNTRRYCVFVGRLHLRLLCFYAPPTDMRTFAHAIGFSGSFVCLSRLAQDQWRNHQAYFHFIIKLDPSGAISFVARNLCDHDNAGRFRAVPSMHIWCRSSG